MDNLSIYANKQGIAYLPWQPLVANDLQVLNAIYDGLRYLDNNDSILESCQFFKDVILRDFPAEIFLQRPLTFHVLLELLKSGHLSIRRHILNCINDLVKCIIARIKLLSNAEFRGTRWKVEDLIEIEDSDLGDQATLEKDQLSIAEFGGRIIKQIILTKKSSEEDTTMCVSLMSNVLELFMLTGNDLKSISTMFQEALLKQWPRTEYMFLIASILNMPCICNNLTPTVNRIVFENFGLPSIVLFFPKLHEEFVKLLSMCNQKELLDDFQECMNICKAMEAANEVIKLKASRGSTLDYFKIVKKALSSLEYHKCTFILQNFIKACENREVSDVEKDLRKDILVKLLSYPDEEIQLAVYQEIFKTVQQYAGAGNYSEAGFADKLEFLYEVEIWKELLCFAITSTSQISEPCQKSIILILESKSLTSPAVWSRLVESIRPCLDLLTIYAGQIDSTFGRYVARFFDPDLASCFSLSPSDVLRGNLRLLFCKAAAVNEMAFTRLCRILENAPDSVNKHLKIEIIRRLDLNTICTSVAARNDNSVFTSFSSSRDVDNALYSLSGQNVDSRTTKSTLDRLVIVMKDVQLHKTFLDKGGLNILVSAMGSALNESDDSYYANSVISITSILFEIVRRDASARMELAAKDQVLLNVLRSLLLFSGDEKFREYTVQLLFLLVYSDQIKLVNHGQPLRCLLSITDVVSQMIHVPLAVQTHAKISPNIMVSRKVLILGNANLIKLLRVYWMALSLGNISIVLSLHESDLEQQDIFTSGLPENLRLTPADLRDLQSSSPVYVMRSLLQSIPNARNHDEALVCIHRLNSCLTWLETYHRLPESKTPDFQIVATHNDDLNCLPWVSTFEKFLLVPPESADDESLLNHILLFLNRLITIMENKEVAQWVLMLLTKPTCVLYKLLKRIGEPGQGIEGRELRLSVTELSYSVLSYCTQEEMSTAAEWLDVLKLILEYLKTTSNVNQPVDWIIGLLAEITGLSWNFNDKRVIYHDLITAVMDILVTFNGFAEPRGSFLCTNVLGNALISLRNLLTDGASIKNYEIIWQKALETVCNDNEEDVSFKWMLALTFHKDPVVRLSSLSLISGFFCSNLTYEVLVTKLALDVNCSWNFALAILFDDHECSQVKENAADLLAKMTALGSVSTCADFTSLVTINFFQAVASIVSRLDVQEQKLDLATSVTTPSLVSAIYRLLLAFCNLNPTDGSRQIAERGLLHAILTSITNVETFDEGRLVMAISGMKLVGTCIAHSAEAQTIVSSSRDYLRATVAFINPKLTEVFSPQLLDSLWTETFNLISTMLVKLKDGPILLQETSVLRDREFYEVLLLGLETATELKDASRSLLANLACPELSDIFTADVTSGQTLAVNVCAALLSDLTPSTVALSNLLMISDQAQSFAQSRGLADTLVLEIKKINLRLKSHSVDNLRKAPGRKKIDLLLDKLQEYYQLVMHFCHNNPNVKTRLADCGLADAVNGLWLWYDHRPALLMTVLKMLCIFTDQSERASQSLALTSSPAGLRKSPGSVTLVHSLIHLTTKEMDQFNKDKDNLVLNLCLEVLGKSCKALECCVVLAKSGILAPITKMLDSFTKKKQYADILKIWLTFLAMFTESSEGQIAVCQNSDALEFIYTTAASTKPTERKLALITLNQMAANPLNRVRLLSKPNNLIAVIRALLERESEDEVELSAYVLWSLAANFQKGKLILRNAGCVTALEEARQRCFSKQCLGVIDNALNILSVKQVIAS